MDYEIDIKFVAWLEENFYVVVHDGNYGIYCELVRLDDTVEIWCKQHGTNDYQLSDSQIAREIWQHWLDDIEQYVR